MHQAPDGKMGQHQPIELLAHQIGLLTVQDHLGASQMRLDFIERCLYLPALMVQRRHFCSRRRRGIQNRRHQALERFGTRHAFYAVPDHTHANPIGPVPLVSLDSNMEFLAGKKKKYLTFQTDSGS
jgi:hypothetical protein